MPIYEYACGACAHRFETIRKASEEPLRDCPECGESALKKLLSAPVFRLKGGGWYETDFKTGDKKNLTDGPGGKTEGEGSAAKEGEGKSSEAGVKDAGAKQAGAKKTDGPAPAKESAKSTGAPAAKSAPAAAAKD